MHSFALSLSSLNTCLLVLGITKWGKTYSKKKKKKKNLILWNLLEVSKGYLAAFVFKVVNMLMIDFKYWKLTNVKKMSIPISILPPPSPHTNKDGARSQAQFS